MLRNEVSAAGPSAANAAQNATVQPPDPFVPASRPAREPPVVPSPLLEPIPLQALTKDIAPSPELAATIAILFYPLSTAEAAAAKHAREFAAPFGKISSLLVKRHAVKGLYTLATFAELEAAAAATAAELTSPISGHLPRVVQWTSQLKSEFAGAGAQSTPAHTASSSTARPVSSAARPAQPDNSRPAGRPRDTFAGRGASATPMHNSRHGSLPLASSGAPGDLIIIISGYASHIDANGRTSHAVGSFEGISGVNFIAATKCQGRDEADSAVLISLTSSAASQFAKKHIYGLEMMLLAGPVALNWEQLSLTSARQALGLDDAAAADASLTGTLLRPGSAPAGLQQRPLSAASRTSSHGDLHSPTSHASSALEPSMPADDLPSPTPGGTQIWQLSKFPIACPLGHVQLYIAAAAAAAGQALTISVGLAKTIPYRPVAWVEMDSNVAFHPKHSRRRSPVIDGTQPVFLPSRGATSALPAPAQAPGQTVILIQGFTMPVDLMGVQRRADGCCLGLEGIHFCMATYQRENEPPPLVALVSLTTPAAFRFRARHPDRTIRPMSAGQTSLSWKEVSLPQAGKLLASPCKWLNS
ncbi:hypothetical protein WJX84_004699 [Apatococcus fuscideae]|uniref:RRM domain-containing protein n=1 Tax=Apatococcus fuscideae TaxID=2026836 RepID=A0AAW1SSM4_9CHLO